MSDESSAISEVVDLAKLLRQNGDKVLNATCKLSLSTMLLHHLNDAFSLVVSDSENDLETSFQVCNSSKNDIYRDYKFLHDFVQKTVGLKVTHNPSHPVLHIDISKFRHLRYLELQKVCIEYLKGLQGIRGQLECVVCTGGKGIGNLECLLAKCGGDAGISFVWSSLLKLCLCYNNLTQLDTSLELAPWLQMLDLSHNLITKADELACLPHVKYMNIGYNKLESIPKFHKASSQTLQKLVLKNNYIDNLTGLQGLENLRELDLSYNCLMDHCVLWPLEVMSSLSWLSLEGNPLAYHPYHRLFSVRHLHPSIGNTKFILDQQPLSKSERRLVSENRIFTMRSVRSTSKNISLSIRCPSNSDFATRSLNSGSYLDESAKNQMMESIRSVEEFPEKAKKRNLKEAVISDFDNNHEEEFMSRSVNLTSSYKATSDDHLETKRQILALREKFGENNWLSSQAGTFVQNIMGLPSISKVLTSSSFADNISTTITAEVHSTNNETNETNKLEENLTEGRNEMSDSLVEKDSFNESVETVPLTPEPVYDPDEEKGNLYLVQIRKTKDSSEDIYLILTNDDITERDPITGKVKCKWATNSVLSCVMGRDESTTVSVSFDTTRRDRQNRIYIADLEDAKKIVHALNEVITAKPILLKVFKCMKCSTHFSRDSDDSAVITTFSDTRQPKCPSCHSTLVIQTDELNMPSGDTSLSDAEKHEDVLDPPEAQLHHSASHSSIGSATSLDDSRESTPANGHAKKYESDIEVLSNPSQSSIEVLDEGSRSNHTPKRKRSSEERRVAVAPTLLTIPDTTPVMTGLTESSSSGSLTDSVCTAYENKITKLSEISEVTDSGFDSEGEKLLGGVAGANSSVKLAGELKQPKGAKSEEAANQRRNVQYSYTDFKSLDHRIKLHIILNVFEQENEVLILLLRAEIMRPGSRTTFPGILILSTSKVYILKIDGSEGDDPEQWLKKDMSWTIDRLRSFAPLPYKQGVLVEMELPSKTSEEPNNAYILCLLQDFQRTSNLLFYLTDTPIPANCEVECSVPIHCNDGIKSILQCSKNYRESDSIRILAMLESVTLEIDSACTKLPISAVLVTSSAIIVLSDEMQWLLPQSKQKPKIIAEQTMSNLVDVKLQETVLILNFLDKESSELWTLGFVSENAAEAVVDSIKAPWEELFSAPMRVRV